MVINFIFASIFILRLFSLFFSIINEKRLISLNAQQIGEKNSKYLSIAHVAFYFCAIIEANIRKVNFDGTSQIGLILVIFALIMLVYVIYELRAVWTVKVYILPNHPINRSWLFRTIKHPNYFLNIIPELIGITLLCHSFYTAMVGLPIYLYILWIRIQQETEAMKNLF